MNNIKQLTELRERTSLPLKECNKALLEAGTVDDAIILLKKWGELKGKEKASVVATEGVVKAFANPGTMSIIELTSNTDFLARSKEFIALVDMCCNPDVLETAFESARHELIAKSGENITLRRKEVFESKTAGSLFAYNHPGNRLAVIVDINVQNIGSVPLSNNAVMQSEKFIETCNDVAMQIAAMAATVVSKNDLTVDMLIAQRSIFEAQLTEEKKPRLAWEKIIDGKFAKWRKDMCLLEQESIKHPKKSVEDVLDAASKELGCEIVIKRFVRYALGEGISVVKGNLADEVAKML